MADAVKDGKVNAQTFADVGVRCHGGNDFVAQILWIAGGEAHTHFRRGLSHKCEQRSHIHRLTAIGTTLGVTSCM